MTEAWPWKTTREEASALLARARTRAPRLSANGLRAFTVEDEEKERAAIATAHAQAQIAAAADWLRLQTRTKSVRRKRNSYGYKHDVEQWARQQGVSQYVANGSFIAAALGLGFEMKRDGDSPNAYFNIASKPG